MMRQQLSSQKRENDVVFIRGMEMPQNCGDCDLSKRWHSSMGDIIDCKRIGTVGSAFNDPYTILINRHPNCPLAEISFNKEQMEVVNKMLKERG